MTLKSTFGEKNTGNGPRLRNILHILRLVTFLNLGIFKLIYLGYHWFISVNSISWAPHEYGLMLAAGSSDGKISILTYKEDGTWEVSAFSGHPIGTNSVSWASATQSNIKRFASGGCDNLVKIFQYWSCNQVKIMELGRRLVRLRDTVIGFVTLLSLLVLLGGLSLLLALR